MDLPISPLAPSTMPDMPTIDGVRIGTANSGTKYHGRDDVLVMQFPRGTMMAGVYTRNRCPGAPIDWNRPLTPGGVDTLVVNAGNANVFTGQAGADSVAAMAAAAPGEVVTVSSTGVIGEPLDDAMMVAAIEGATDGKSWVDAANAILTTDTFAKYATASFITDAGQRVTLNGIAKGSGMIAPDMATMLGYIVTDAGIGAEASSDYFQSLLAAQTQTTFNAITVDSDQSTSDTLQLFATGAVMLETATDFEQFEAALYRLNHQLSDLIIRDGEGATKLVHIAVHEAETQAAAHAIALAVANSPLVKTAMAGNDANWGRIVAAIGKSGQLADRDQLWIKFGDVLVAQDGQRHPSYSEDAATAVVSQQQVFISVGVGIGEGSATVRTCDLTHGYISINGDYRS